MWYSSLLPFEWWLQNRIVAIKVWKVEKGWRSSSFGKINGVYSLEKDRHKKLIVSHIILWVPSSLTILYIFFSFFLSLSLQIKEMDKNINGEDPNSIWLHLMKVLQIILIETNEHYEFKRFVSATCFTWQKGTSSKKARGKLESYSIRSRRVWEQVMYKTNKIP